MIGIAEGIAERVRIEFVILSEVLSSRVVHLLGIFIAWLSYSYTISCVRTERTPHPWKRRRSKA